MAFLGWEWLSAISVLFVPAISALGVLGPFSYDQDLSFAGVVCLNVGVCLLLGAPGLVFLFASKRTVRWTAFAIYAILVLLALYGFAWFGENVPKAVPRSARYWG